MEKRPGRQIIAAIGMLLLAMGCFAVLHTKTVSAEEADTETEKRVVRVGYYITPGFQDYDEETGEYGGYSYEYLLALKQYTNWEYEFVQVDFSDAVDMLERGELDLMNNVSITEERKNTLNFSEYASGTNYACLVTRSDNTNYALNEYEDFDHIRVGLLRRSIFNEKFFDLCKQKHFEADVTYFDSEDEISQALTDGTIDARVVSSSYNMDKKRVIAKFSPMDYYFAVPKNKTDIYEELNHALEDIKEQQPELEQTLEQKYYSTIKEENVVLSKKEKEYLKEHPVVKVACTRSWYPISYYDKNNNYSGPLADLYKEIAQKTGLRFDFVPYDNYTDALDAFEKGETEMLCEMPQDYIFADRYQASITDEVAPVSVYRVTKGNRATEDIHTAAILRNTYIGSMAKKRLDADQVKITEYDTTDECVDAVFSGEADCTYINAYQSYYYQSKGRYLSLRYILIPEMQYNLSLSITRNEDGQILKSIVVKGLSAITDKEIKKLFQNTASDEAGKQDLEVLFYQNPILVVIGSALASTIAVIVLCFVIYSRKMQAKNAELIVAKQKESSFLSRMSHDIRTPLNGIIGMTKLALSEDQSGEEYRDYLQKIDSSGQYLSELVNNILDFKKIEEDKLDLKQEKYFVEELNRHICDIITPLCEEKQIIFDRKNIIAKKGAIITDKIRLNQILMNLLSNAVKYTPEGGTVRIYSENTSFAENHVTTDIVVADNEIGMSEEFQKHMFDSFAQENPTIASGGSGLGLSIVKLLVERMGGEIHVRSRQGEGTSVVLHFTFAYEQGERISAKPEEYEKDFLSGKRILVCEDNEMNAEITKRVLESKQGEVILTENGQLGVEAFAASDIGYYDVILMDIRMPVMNGIEATKEIRRMKRADAKTVPIIAMTADAYDVDMKRSKEAGMNIHLSKPIDVAELYHVLYRLLC